MTPQEARMSFPTEDFKGQCTCFPDRILGPRGWANLNPYCRTHDWHYWILRTQHGEWSTLEWDRYKEWADANLWAGVRMELRKAWGPWVGAGIARAMWAAVRSRLGEAAARQSW